MVEQWTENPCVSGSIPLLDIFKIKLNKIMLKFFHSELGLIYLICIYFISGIFLYNNYFIPFCMKLKKRNTEVLEDILSHTDLPNFWVRSITLFLRWSAQLLFLLSLASYLYCFHPEFYSNHIFYCLGIIFSLPKW